MPFHLDILKRHSDPAPCTKAKGCSGATTQPATHSDPDLRFANCGSSSPSRGSISSKVGVNSSPSSHGHLRRSRAIRYRRLSSTGYTATNGDYFNGTQRRATHPNTSPRRFRRGSLWLEDVTDPWMQYRLKGLGSVIPNGDDKPFMTSTEGDGPCYRLRSFSVTSKGVLNLGDCMRARSHSDASVSSEELEQCFRTRRDSAGSTTSSLANGTPSSKYKVLLLGAEGVGKTSLVAQFTTSDSLTSFTDLQSSLDGSVERTVSLMVDGEESELTCEDPVDAGYELDDEIYCATNAFVVVFSVADRKSYQNATKILEQLRDLKSRCTYLYPGTTNKAIIMVANKVDLVRSRVVSSEEARFLADRYEIKYVETSVGFNHNVDELLVGIVTQIRLQRSHQTYVVPRPLGFSCKAKGMMNKLLQKCELKTRSCDNLHVL